jgi:hypothetical protein
MYNANYGLEYLQISYLLFRYIALRWDPQKSDSVMNTKGSLEMEREKQKGKKILEKGEVELWPVNCDSQPLNQSWGEEKMAWNLSFWGLGKDVG